MSRRPLRGPRIRSARGGGGRIPFLPLIIALVVLFGAGLGGAHIVASATSPTPAQVSTCRPPPQVLTWIGQAIPVLEQNGTPAAALNANDICIIIMGESGGDPKSINLTDSNAQAGHPSKGLMQCIDGTFQAHAVPGHNSDIYDPVSSIVAGVRYAIGRYGSLDQTPGVAAVHAGGHYVGY